MQNTDQLQSGSVFIERPLTPQSDGFPISNTPAPRWLQRWWFMPSTRDHTKSCCRLVSCISAPDHISLDPADHETVKVSLEPALPFLVHFTINNPLVTFRRFRQPLIRLPWLPEPLRDSYGPLSTLHHLSPADWLTDKSPIIRLAEEILPSRLQK